MEMEDLTEYEFATTYLDGWEHWELLLKSNWFIPYINRWRKELDLKIKSQALKQIKKYAKENGNNSFQANKILIDRSWETKGSQQINKRGRPSKEELDGELKRQAEEEKKLQEDWERLNNS